MFVIASFDCTRAVQRANILFRFAATLQGLEAEVPPVQPSSMQSKAYRPCGTRNSHHCSNVSACNVTSLYSAAAAGQ